MHSKSYVEKNRVLAAVLSKAKKGWVRQGLGLIPDLAGHKMTGEEIRYTLVNQGMEEPHHHNVWGALILLANKKGLLRETGKYAPSTTPSSHCRRSRIYEVLGSSNGRTPDFDSEGGGSNPSPSAT